MQLRGTSGEAAPMEVGVLVEVYEPAGAGRHGLAVEDLIGNFMNQPVDKFNHAIDALRYVCMDRKLAERRVMRVRRV